MVTSKPKKRGKIRRRRAVSEAPVEDLLQSLTVDQLRAVARQLGVTLDGRDSRLKQDLISTLQEHRDQTAVRATAHEIEAATPYSNLFFAGISGRDLHTKIKRLATSPAETFNGLRRSFHKIHDDRFLLVFEHQVPTREFKLDERTGGYFPFDELIRHPLITWIDLKHSTLTVSYPGYNQGSVEAAQRIDYEQVIKTLLSYLKEKENVVTTNLPIRTAINDLCDKKSSRLNIIGANPENLSGIARIRVHAKNQVRNSIDTWLTENIKRFGPTLDQPILAEAIYRFVREMSEDVISVHWIEEKISSRISTWEIGTEFHFTWKQVHRSYHLIQSVVSLLLETGKTVSKGTIKSAWDYIVALDADARLKPTSLIEKFHISAEETKALVTNALDAGLVRPVFRLHTHEDVRDLTDNSWRVDAADLKREFYSHSGKLIDGRNPKNIEIAFARRG